MTNNLYIKDDGRKFSIDKQGDIVFIFLGSRGKLIFPNGITIEELRKELYTIKANIEMYLNTR